MPIPNAVNAVVPIEKLTDDLLDSEHPVGGAKARWFNSLGYDAEQPERLAADLLASIQNSERFSQTLSPDGIKYVVRSVIVAPNGDAREVQSIWIQEPGQPGPRLVTAYPARALRR